MRSELFGLQHGQNAIFVKNTSKTSS